MKTSIPKLHKIKWKNGTEAENIHILNNDMDTPARQVLSGAYNMDLKDVVLIGYEQSGKEYIAGTTKDIMKAAYMFSRANLQLLRNADG